MKNNKKLLLLVAFALFGITYSADAQLYVKTKPGKPAKIKMKSEPGSRDEVYIDEDWEPQGTQYVWNGDRWVKVPKPDNVWIPGYWVEKKKGWVWIPGHWEDKK